MFKTAKVPPALPSPSQTDALESRLVVHSSNPSIREAETEDREVQSLGYTAKSCLQRREDRDRLWAHHREPVVG